MLTFEITIINFILLNLLTIIVVGLVYFVLKEFYRIRGGAIGKIGVSIIGVIMGLFIIAVNWWVSNIIYFDTKPAFGFVISNGLILSPSIIIIIIFSTSLDKRLIYPMMLTQTISLLIILPKVGVLNGVDASAFWGQLLFEFVIYSVLIVTITFIPELNLIKNNGFRLIAILTLYLIALFVTGVIYHSVINTSSTSASNVLTLETIQILYVVLYSGIQTSIIFIVNKVYSNYSALETFSVKDDVSYYKISLAQNTLTKIIDKEKISIGILILFDIKTDDSEKASNTLKDIKESTEDKYANSFFFKASVNYYGAFYSLSDDFQLERSLKNNKAIERDSNDELKLISDSLKLISIKNEVEVISAGSIYGIHSYNIPELIEYSKFLLSPIVSRANSNSLIIYDFKRVKDRLNETSRVKELPVDIENISISFQRGLNPEDIFYPSISFKGEDGNLFGEIKNKQLSIEQINTLLRFTSYQTLRKFDKANASLIIYYPIDHLSSDNFNIKDFIKKTSRHIELNKLIIGVDTSYGKTTDMTIENINNLRSNGIRFALTNPGTLTQEEHDIWNPDFIVDPNTSGNILKIKKIKIEIKTNASILNSHLVL